MSTLSPFASPALRAAARPAEVVGRSFDQQAMQRIEASRKTHAACRDIRVRATADERRLSSEEATQLAGIKTTYGADGVDALRAHCVSARAAATAEIDAYAGKVDAVAEALIALGESV